MSPDPEDNPAERDPGKIVKPTPFESAPPISNEEWTVMEALTTANVTLVPYVYDGSKTTRWQTATKGERPDGTIGNVTPLPQGFTLDLGKRYRVIRMALNNDWQGLGEYQIEMGDEVDNLTHQCFAPVNSNNRPSYFVFDPPLIGRYFRLIVTKAYSEPGKPSPNYAYLSELALDGDEVVGPTSIIERCEGEPVTINWDYSVESTARIYSFVLLKREDLDGPAERLYIRKDQRHISIPARFGDSPDWIYFSMITTGKNENGSVWESAESNHVSVKYNPNRPFCSPSPEMAQPEPPPQVSVTP